MHMSTTSPLLTAMCCQVRLRRKMNLVQVNAFPYLCDRPFITYLLLRILEHQNQRASGIMGCQENV